MGKIAIACQGGGSHTAFTAGALRTLLERNVHKEHQLVGLSGTSGGAVCALLTWYGLLRRDREPVHEPLMSFWSDNTARLPWEEIWNEWSVGLTRMQGSGVIPEFKLSPYTSSATMLMEQVQHLAPREEFLDFPGLLKKHVRFDELKYLITPSSPRLLLGAVDVRSSGFKTFDSWKTSPDSRENEITLDAVLASAAIPTLFQAVEIHGKAYWDGLFSENPPVNSFLEETDSELKPTEIWIIQINPTARREIPRSTQDILDRRNELAGNLSLLHAIHNIQRINEWIDEGFTDKLKAKKGYQPITLRKMTMSEELMKKLDYASKIDRGESHIQELIEDGARQASDFLDDLDGHAIRDADCKKP